MRSQISDDITFRKLEILLAYMEGGNLNAAARMLDISAVSVHRALHSLEEGTRCQLFSLKGRNLVPLDAAQVLADTSREVVRLMAEGIEATRRAAGYSADSLKIGSLYSLTTGAVPEVIIGIKLRKPELSTELVLGDGHGQVEVGHSLDVGSVRMTERHLHEDPPAASSVVAAAATIDAALDTLPDHGVHLASARTAVAVSGTGLTVAAAVLETDGTISVVTRQQAGNRSALLDVPAASTS